MDIVEAIGKVLLVGLVFGAGLPALFAVGMRVHSLGSDQVADEGTIVSHGNPAMRMLAYATVSYTHLTLPTILRV